MEWILVSVASEEVISFFWRSMYLLFGKRFLSILSSSIKWFWNVAIHVPSSAWFNWSLAPAYIHIELEVVLEWLCFFPWSRIFAHEFRILNLTDNVVGLERGLAPNPKSIYVFAFDYRWRHLKCMSVISVFRTDILKKCQSLEACTK